MKQFAFPLSVKCANVNERDECINILKSLGYVELDRYLHDSETLVVTNYSGYNNLITAWVFKSDYDEDRRHIDHLNPDLIRDIAAVCTNDTWQGGELWVSSRGKLSRIVRYVGFSVNPNGHRRPTIAEICAHHGYEIKGRDIVKKIETVSNCDKSYCETARQLDEAKAEIKRLKDENVKLSDMTLYATREMNKYNGLYNSVINREGIVKQLIRDIASELDMDLD